MTEGQEGGRSSWRIIYRVAATEVTVTAVVHGARLLRNAPPL